MAQVDEAQEKDIGLGRELGRKAIHVGALVVPLGLWFLPTLLAQTLLVCAFLILASIDMARWGDTRLSRWVHRSLWKVLRPHERRQFSGGTYILAGSALTALLYPKPVAVAAIICIILGDTAAVFVGRSFGKIKIGDKTVEGSLAFFVTSILAILWIPGLPMSAKIFGALVAAFVEALPLPMDDNLSVPLLSGLAMVMVL